MDNGGYLMSSSYIVFRVDQDFDQSRVPSLLDRLLPVSRPRVSPLPQQQVLELQSYLRKD